MSLTGNVLSAGFKGTKALNPAVTGGILVGSVGLKGFSIVPEGSAAVKVRRGQATRLNGKRKGELYGVEGPGLKFNIPFLESYKLVSIQQMSSALPVAKADIRDQQFEIATNLLWSVDPSGDNPYKALYKPDSGKELQDSIIQIVAGGLYEVLCGITKTKLKKPGELSGLVKEASATELLDDFGVQYRRLDILRAHYTEAEKNRQALREHAQILAGSMATHNVAALIPPQPIVMGESAIRI